RLIGEGHGENLGRPRPARRQDMGDPGGQDAGFAGPGPGQHQNRAVQGLDRLPLLGIEVVEIACRAGPRRQGARRDAARHGGRGVDADGAFGCGISQEHACCGESWVENGTRALDLRGCAPQGGDVSMKAILLTRTGDPSVLDYVEVPTPRPGPGEVLVKADTIGVSRPELLVRRGVYAWMPPLPIIPGIEMTGTVAERGSGATRFDVGQKVYVTARELPVRAGCYAEYIAVPERALFALPPQADLEAGACLSNYQVAWHLLHTATRGAPGKTVLIGSALGGLGSAAVQLAKLAGLTAIALAGSAAKARALEAYGADHVIDHGREDVA